LLDYLNVRYLLVEERDVAIDPKRFELVYDGRDGRIFRNRDALPRFYPVRDVRLVPPEQFNRTLVEHRDFANSALLESLDGMAPQMKDDFFKPRPPNAPRATSQIAEASGSAYRVRVQAPRWSLVVSSIPWWPGWQVERNGTHIDPIRVNGRFLGFAVPPGASDVRVFYAPWTFRLGAIVAAATALSLVAYGLRRRRKAS
jgi:hypothetical protein